MVTVGLWKHLPFQIILYSLVSGKYLAIGSALPKSNVAPAASVPYPSTGPGPFPNIQSESPNCFPSITIFQDSGAVLWAVSESFNKRNATMTLGSLYACVN